MGRMGYAKEATLLIRVLIMGQYTLGVLCYHVIDGLLLLDVYCVGE